MWITTTVIDGQPQIVGVEMWSIDPAALEKWATGLTPKQAESHWKPVDPDRDPGSIRSTDLRVPLSRIKSEEMAVRRQTAAFLSDPEFLEIQPDDDWTKSSKVQTAAKRVLELTDEVTPGKKRAGRPALPFSHYQAVADTYTAALESGLNPTNAVRERFVVTKSCASKWIYRCRRAPYNLLEPTDQGRAAGNPTTRRSE